MATAGLQVTMKTGSVTTMRHLSLLLAIALPTNPSPDKLRLADPAPSIVGLYHVSGTDDGDGYSGLAKIECYAGNVYAVTWAGGIATC